ncbi:DUF4331 domain-containing protein [Allobranchiibius huperziae]|uniref:DUF4331 domain-containing protein n=1 Tax=Allobranchiibius huperziae TaxID=1874116 RepID=UPI0015C6C7A7|nr:DUF4331 domain-containing protein [Allobranchiibius huperziae]
MSSHREAPEISKDPSADNTDVYAFVSPDKPGTVTLIANFMPFELPYGGPNFNEFADTVVYTINVSNSGRALADISYQFTFKTQVRNPNSFLYNVGPISSPTDANWNRPQTFTVERVDLTPPPKYFPRHLSGILGKDLTCPPVNVGIRSTPNYPTLAAKSYHQLAGGRMVFAGQRADGFHVDLGSIFDLGDLRPFQGAYNKGIPPVLANMPGVNGLLDLNVHTIAIQVPLSDLTVDGKTPTDVMSANSVIGVWATASRSTSRILNKKTGKYDNYGAWTQVSRLGNPLVNEVINPMGEKDLWNINPPRLDSQFAKYVLQPELANLIANVLYPTAFPNLAAYVKSKKPRADLAAILLTGIPKGVVPGFQNYTGSVQADMLRLNLAVPPTAPSKANKIGLIAGDAAGFPNGRRPIDDVTAIELRAVAGATIPLVDKSYKPDAAATSLNDGSTEGTANDNAPYGVAYLSSFPYLSNPNSGFTSKPGKPGGQTVN